MRAPPDGYTLLWANSAKRHQRVPLREAQLHFIRDIATVAGVVRVPQVMEVNPSFQAKTVPEFIAHAKANPGKLNFGSAGNGSALHVAGELFKMMAGRRHGFTCPIAAGHLR